MSSETSKSKLWGGRILTTLSILFMVMDGGMKLVRPVPPPVAEAFARLGWPVDLARPLGVVILMSVALYAVPRTAVLGGILLTGFLGGAVATHARVEDALFSHTLFPVYIGIMLWAALFLRDARVSALFRGAPRGEAPADRENVEAPVDPAAARVS